MGRGMCRSTIITYLNAPGAHTSSLPLADAVTARSATYSLSTVSGASLIVRAHPGANLPGSDDQHPNSILAQRFPETKVEAVEAGLGGAIHEVGPPYPLAGSRAHRDDLAEALCAHLLAEQHADRNRCGVVDLGDLHRLSLVLPQLLGVTEQAERHDRDVDVTAGEGRVDHLGMALGVDGVEVDQLHGASHRRPSSARRRRRGRGRRAARPARCAPARCAGSARRSPDRSRTCRRAAGWSADCLRRPAPFRAAPSVGPCRRRTPRWDRPCDARRSTRRYAGTWRGRFRRWCASPWRCRAGRRIPAPGGRVP